MQHQVVVLFLLTLCLFEGVSSQSRDGGLFPVIFNLAANSRIVANATCGENGPETFCKLVEHVPGKPAPNPQCRVCDAFSLDPREQHPVENAIDGTNSWWQSPSIANGMNYHFVTITLDLQQIFQVAYVIVKAANSPRPGNWILEKSIDGVTFHPWQYYAISDSECVSLYKIQPTIGNPRYKSDDDVICTSFYSKLNPLKNGEIHTSLVNGRPSVLNPSATLMEFTSARFIRLRFQRVRTLNADLMTLTSNEPGFIDPLVTRRYYYSIKDISVGGQCICFGHARICPQDPVTLALRCECEHNTCGDQCQQCCPGYQQKAWQPGTQEQSNLCEPCNCHGHTDDCYFDQEVSDRGESLNINGDYEGGGVCIDCKHNTMGVNCDMCIDRYYRPANVARTDPDPCIPCNCNAFGIREESGVSLGACVKDDSQINEGLNPGDCYCKEGYDGAKCDRCARGYKGFPNCEKCPCSDVGSINDDVCEPPCLCKSNTEGGDCDTCKPGYFNLDGNNPDGCSECFCFGITDVCFSAPVINSPVESLYDWRVGDADGDRYIDVEALPGDSSLVIQHPDVLAVIGSDVLYWYAPEEYLGNKLPSYGSFLRYTIQYDIIQDANQSTPLLAPDVIIRGNGVTLKQRASRWVLPDRPETFNVMFAEDNWFHEDSDRFVSQVEFMKILENLDALLIRATYHTVPVESAIYDIALDYGDLNANSTDRITSVEQCNCPPGYAGLSCQGCIDGYRRVGGDLYDGQCVLCQCNLHALECDDITGDCLQCEDNTAGDHCQTCADGYYGDATQGTPTDCQRCACPLTDPSNNFSPTCVSDGSGGFLCDYCDIGYEGPRCDRCADGYYGNPLVLNDTCKPCMFTCNNNLNLDLDGNCNTVTGECLKCAGNTAGASCNRCADGYYGDAIFAKNCTVCQCYRTGSASEICDDETGQCDCKQHVTGQYCNVCEPGYWDILSGKGCGPCFCNPIGADGVECDIVDGQCNCKPGVIGRSCDRCQAGYYNFTEEGCQLCDCERTGGSCDSVTGECICPPNTIGLRCEQCAANSWGHHPVEGCKLCNCSEDGSSSLQCDSSTGQCDCKADYRGQMCNQCLFGYRDFPKCRECKCSEAGTEPSSCNDDGLCECLDDGQCECKANVASKRCTKCADNAFGFREDLSTGCTQCFCFGITQECHQADYVREQLTVTPATNAFFISDDRSVFQTQTGVLFTPAEVRLNASGPLEEIQFTSNLYWNLPQAFLGNKITSYGGRLRYTVQYFGQDVGEDDVLDIIIKGRDFSLVKPLPNPFSGIPMSYDLELLENEWELRDAIFLDYAPRDLFMMVLYDIQAIMIRATYGPDTEGAVLSDLSVEIGIPKSDDPSLPEAMDIEECACPEGYQGLSCQECAPGYVRVSNGPYLGSCRPCTCNNHGQMCDSSTGICEDCQDNTYGPMCEFCEDGYYGNATNGNEDDCKPCACPRVESSNNFSPTCEFHSDGGHLCTNCEVGYVGRHCESCDEGYFGEPSVLGGRCELCDCNTHGSLSQTCDPVTGQCECEEGISGRACDVCQHRHILTQQGCHSCDDTCTGLLLDEVEALTALLTAPNITGIVPAPWPRLRSLINATEFLEPKLESYKNALEGAAQLVNSLPNGIDGLQENVTEMLQRSVDVKMAASETADHASASNMRADDVELLLNNTLDKLKDLIQNLEELADSISSGQPALETEALLMEAQKILDEMLARDFSQQDQAAVDELDLAKEALRKTQRRFMDKVNENMALADRINGSIMDLVDKFSELIDLSQDVQGTLDEVAQNNTDMKNLLSELQMKLKNMMDSEGEMVSMLDMGRQLLEDATDLLAEGYRVLEQTMVESDDLAASLPDLRIKAGLLQQNMDDLPDLVTRAEQHADQLAEFADMLEDLFQGTRDLAEIPVKAAKVYDEIVDTVMDANITAHEAKMLADEALKQASDSTGIDDSLEDRAKNSKLRSQNLHGDAMAKDSDVDALEGRLTTVRQDIETIKSTSQEAEEKLRAIKAEIPNLPTDLSSRAQDALQKAEEALGRAATAKQKTEDVEDALPTQQDKFTELSDNTEMIGNDLDTSERSLDRTKASLGQLLDLTDRLTFKAAGIRSLQALMANNITSIKEKIAQAKNQANSIKISVDTSATCIRGYSPNVLPSFYNTIVIHFKTTQANNMVLYLGSVTNNDFMSLETLGGKVKFQWDVGAGVGFVTHPLSVDNDKWYKVEANRYGPAGELAVQLATSNIEPEIVRGKAPSEYSILDVNPDSDLYIGGIPADYENNALSVKSFAGCVGETLINEERVGLFNFKESGGDCTGCVESPGPSPTADTYQFDGSGYAIMPKIRNWNTESTTIQFSFRSFDENALLFYVTDDKKDFMSIELNDGRIAFRYDLGGGVAELISPAKYNSGDWVRVSARRGRQNGILTVEGANVAQGASPGNLKGLSINEFMYFGGTPIETADSVVSHSFTGCMRDILVNLNAQELNVENVGLLGVEDGCIQKPIRNAGLMGNGYVEMPPANLGTDGAITISFATLQPNALVLVAQDMNSRRRRQINADASGVYYSIMLHDGRVQIQVNAGKGELLLSTRKSAGTFNDGEFHVASIVKEGKNVRLTVDDLASRGGNLPDDDVIEVNRMFVGGVSEDAQDDVGGAAEVIIPFGGCVQDLVVDGVLQDLAKTTGFERANLAHCMPLSEIDIPPPVTAMPTPVDLQLPTTIASIVTPDGESCYQPSTPRTSANTAQFGKSANSHLEFAVAAKSINKEFDITVEVRTFASTGVIFYVGTAGNGQGDFASLQLVDGKPLFSFDNGAGALRLSSNVAVNDGEWHSIVLTRNRRTGTVAVDGGDEVRDRAPEGASSMDIKTSLFIGGVSESLAVPRLEQVVNSLDSCIRKFQISGTTIDLAAPLASVDVTPCYRQVENGAYFEGSGYAVLDETFRVGPDMVISLEFRTTQNNGVILSVANERNDCFGLELVNGQLALRANNGAGMFEAVFTSESEYTLCDNRWHTIKAYKIKNALELIVDDEYTGGGTQEISSSADTNNPLYLGGYPDTALEQKALTIADKFVGCIRNIEIQDNLQDLSQAPELVNVRPNSCPFV